MLMSKPDAQDKVEELQQNSSKSISQAYEKLNAEEAKIMRLESKKCIDKYHGDSVKMTNCYDDFKKTIDGTISKITPSWRDY